MRTETFYDMEEATADNRDGQTNCVEKRPDKAISKNRDRNRLRKTWTSDRLDRGAEKFNDVEKAICKNPDGHRLWQTLDKAAVENRDGQRA